jgi:thiol-disulfide isomerase/thioredoxin
MNMRRTLVLGILLLALAVVGERVSSRVATMDQTAPSKEPVLQFFKEPQALPRFTLRTLDGRTLRGEDLRGKVTIINFWATWCPPCRAEVPDLVALQKKYPNHLQIIGISEDVGSSQIVRQFIAEYRINYPIAMATPETERVFSGVTGLPTTFILDRELRVVQKHVGLLDARRTEYETRALAGLPVHASIERIDPNRPTGLANAAQAKEIPGIDLTQLSPEKRVEILLRLNKEPCTCGCGLTVARCRIEDSACSVSLPLARRIAEEIAKKPIPDDGRDD